ncbi:unnamed protein product, partial [Symbiodinium microadriaticum]
DSCQRCSTHQGELRLFSSRRRRKSSRNRDLKSPSRSRSPISTPILRRPCRCGTPSSTWQQRLAQRVIDLLCPAPWLSK